jgi:uncharacterized protein YqgV (UPF0045/DUF77 family)
MGRGTHLSRELADILKIIDDSHFRYCLTPFGTCLEGEWAEVMAIVKRCHDQARSISKHVLTTIRIEDEDGVNDKLIANVASVERASMPLMGGTRLRHPQTGGWDPAKHQILSARGTPTSLPRWT